MLKHVDRRWLGLLLTSLAVAALLLTLVLVRGQDANWDQLNYHFTLPYELLHGRYEYDVAPSQMQSWFNPLPYVPLYLLALHLNGFWFTVVLTLIQAANGPLLFLLAMRMQAPGRRFRPLIAAIATLIGMSSATVLGEAGSTFFDLISSLFVTAALLATFRGFAVPPRLAFRWWGVAGLLLGVVTGLKLTNGIYGLGAGLALVLTLRGRDVLPAFSGFAVGGLAGFAAAAGWWLATLQRLYGNPFFPYFNRVMKSPWLDGVRADIATGSGADMRFLPGSFTQALGYPVRWASGQWPMSAEGYFRDPRPLVAIVAIILVLICVLMRRLKGAPTAPTEQFAQFVGLFWLASFAIWLGTFAIQRYIVPLEALTGVMIVAGLGVAFPRALDRPAGVACLAVAAAAFAVWTRPPPVSDIPFQRSMLPTSAVASLYRPGALYVMVGQEPMGIVVPAMPSDTRFVRIDGNMRLAPHAGLGRVATRIIAGHPGPIFSLSAGRRPSERSAVLYSFGLRRSGDCKTALVTGSRMTACSLARVP